LKSNPPKSKVFSKILLRSTSLTFIETDFAGVRKVDVEVITSRLTAADSQLISLD